MNGDYYELRIQWDDAPGWHKDEINAHGPSDIIAAVLKQACEGYGALRNLKELTVKPRQSK